MLLCSSSRLAAVREFPPSNDDAMRCHQNATTMRETSNDASSCRIKGSPAMNRKVGMCLTLILVHFRFLLLISTVSYGWITPHTFNGADRRTLSHLSSTCTSESLSTEPESQYGKELTTALLRISYDGAHFTGWSAGQSSEDDEASNDSITSSFTDEPPSSLPFRPSRRRRRRMARNHKSGYVRSVQGIFQKLLAKLYGSVDPSRVVVEGCSRTDKGVHAQFMTAQVYCLSTTASNNNTTVDPNNTITGKRLPHPSSSLDNSSSFEPIPMDLHKLMYVLNRMLPHDCKVLSVAPVPIMPDGTVFHPSLNTVNKTYQYTFSVGQLHDPTKWRTTWHLEYESHFDIEKVSRVGQELLLGTHDFEAFRGAPRGSSDKQRQEMESTICTLSKVKVDKSIDTSTFPGVSLSTYTVTVTGDRFLYKMMRFLVGALVGVGTDKLMYEQVERALQSGSWKEGGHVQQFTCAPPHGLVLKNVEYDVPLEWTTCSNRVSTS